MDKKQKASIQKLMNKKKVAPLPVLKKSAAQIEIEKKKKEMELANNPLAKLMETAKPIEKEEDKFADGFMRSKRNTQLRVKAELHSQIHTLDEQKTELIQKLNRALIKLDRQNTEKREIGEKLLEMVKFVRDLQKAASNGDDIDGVVSTQMKVEFQREKELNFRLKDELKRCEKERLRLLERFKLLSGEKEIEIENTDGKRRTFKVTQVNIQRILEELKLQKDTMMANEDLVNQSAEVCRAAGDEILARERDIDIIRRERDQLTENLTVLENKYRDTVYLNEGARDRAGGMHRMHVKLLATRQLEESLQKMFNLRKKTCVDQMLWVTRGYVNQFGAIYRLRNLILHRNQRQAKGALIRWFKLACDPMMLKEQNRLIPEHFAKRHTQRLVFNREFEQWMLDQGLYKQRLSQMDTVRGKMANFWRRELKLRFNMWKDNVRARVSGLKVLDRLCTKTRYFEMARAFTKWSSLINHQNFDARMHSLAIVTALKQTEAGVFFAWRRWAHSRKHRRLQLKRRCLRSLQVAVKKRKQFQKMALSALGFKVQCNRSILRQCFDAMRQNTASEKLIFTSDVLTVEMEPQIEMLHASTKEIKNTAVRQSRKRATNAFMTLFGKQLMQYFQHWRAQAKTKAVKMDRNFKIKLIKLFRGKLQAAFDVWRNNRSAKVIEMQTMQFEDFQAQNAVIEEVSRKTELQIQAADRSSKNMGAKHIRKLVTAAYQRNMKHYLDRWRAKNVQSNKQINGGEKVLKKMRVRFLRMAWTLYRNGVARVDQDDRNENRLEEVKVRLYFRQKMRMYGAIKLFASRHRTAKRYLKTLVSGIEKHNKDTVMRRWKDFRHSEQLTIIQEKQDQLIGQMGEAVQLDCKTADKLMRSRDKSARSAKNLKTQGQKTMQKWFAKLHGQGMAYGFGMWKQTVDNLKHRERLFTSLKKQMLRNTLRQALIRWGQSCGNFQIMTMQDNISMEMQHVQDNEHKVQRVKDMRKQHADRSGRQLAVVHEEVDKMNKKTSKTIARLMQKNQDCFFTSKLNHVFHGWKAYTDRRRRCCKILTNALYKTAIQKTFQRIGLFAREDHKQFQKEKTANKLPRIYNKYRMKAALTKWREQEHSNIVMLQMQTMEEMSQLQSDFSVKREQIKKTQVAVKCARNDKDTRQKWFAAWQDYAGEERDIRMRTEKLKEVLRARKGANALRKWKQRKELTQKMRQFFRKGKFIKRQLNMKSGFHAWRQQNRIERDFSNKLHAQMENLRNLRCQQAFDLIKRFAAEKASFQSQHKSMAEKALIRCFMNYNEGKLRVSFNKMRQWRDKTDIRDVKLRTALKSLTVKSLRSYFLTWKQKAHQSTVYLQNEEEDGPCNLEAWDLRQENFNLIRLMKDEGLSNSDIARVHKEAEENYQNKVEKSLCHILCKQTEGLSVLPACLARWKKFTQLRKIWRRVLKDAEIRATQNQDVSAKLWAFRRLQYTHEDRQKALWQTPIAELRKICVNNVEKLDKLADQVEATDNESTELMGQRNLLIKGQVASQKLALSLSVQNRQRTLMAAMSKFEASGKNRLQRKIEDAIKGNLDQIGGLKDQIQKLEDDNEGLAKQNDEFRKGAMDGITMVRHVERLTSDRDKLSVDLADKALTIRKLLEDNSYLQNKLTLAQSQAAGLVDATKKQYENDPPVRPTSPTLQTIQVDGRENNSHAINRGGVTIN